VNCHMIALFHSVYKELVNFQKWSTNPNHPLPPPHARIRGPISTWTMLTSLSQLRLFQPKLCLHPL
jgi:hypothetical protein